VGSALLGSALPSAAEPGIPALAHTDTWPGQGPDVADAFDRAYIEGAVEPFARRRIYAGERLALPMIELAFGKEAAIPQHLWGMLYDGWRPNMQEEGLSVFLQGYQNRGPHNARKRIYASALTPDLYRPMYAAKVGAFLDRLFDRRNAGQPLMRHYYAQYFDLYWDLHLGVTGDAVPFEVRQIGNSFNAVIGYWDPRLPVVHENYMRVRALREPLRAWIDARVQDVIDGMVARPESTFVHYWLRNGQQSENFRRKDIVFECFHNFLAFSQWGNALYNIMERLDQGGGDPGCQVLVPADHGRHPRQGGRIGLHAARPARDGAVPHHLPEDRKPLGPEPDAGAGRERPQLHPPLASADEPGSAPLGGPG
jgi:hypothetical protein